MTTAEAAGLLRSAASVVLGTMTAPPPDSWQGRAADEHREAWWRRRRELRALARTLRARAHALEAAA